MIIRLVSLDDAEDIADIYKYYVDNYPYSFEYTAPDSNEFRKRIADVTSFYPFYVCEDNGEVIGFANAHKLKEREAYKWLCESTIYVKHGITQQGIGTALYKKLLPSLKRQRLTKVFAGIGCPNEGSEHFHEKMGFKLLATFPNMGYKHGAWHDVKHYVYDLNAVTDNMEPPIPFEKNVDIERILW